MDIGMLAICIGVIVAVYNFVMSLRSNKKKKEQSNNFTLKALGKSLALGLVAYIVVINIDFGEGQATPVEYEAEETISAESEEESIAAAYETEENVSVEYESVAESESETVESEYEYTFRSKQLLEEHYEKHGIFMKYKSAEKYQKGANRVINDKETLHAIEAEDGDDVYYLERTNEFVVVSKDGYIRTYFCPEDGIEYFHRQYE